VNTKAVLLEANDLVGNGQRNAAINLLLEYIETDPDSSVVLKALGRVYLLDKQPEKAVVFLKKSLEISQSGKVTTENSFEYRPNDFGDDDMGFVESQADEFFEADYDLESDESHESNLDKCLTDKTKEILTAPELIEALPSMPEASPKAVNITYKSKKIIPLNKIDLNESVVDTQEVEDLYDDVVEPIVDEITNEDDILIDDNTVNVENITDLPLPINTVKPIEIIKTKSVDIDVNGQLDFDEFIEDYFVDDDQVEVVDSDEVIPEEVL